MRWIPSTPSAGSGPSSHSWETIAISPISLWRNPRERSSHGRTIFCSSRKTGHVPTRSRNGTDGYRREQPLRLADYGQEPRQRTAEYEHYRWLVDICGLSYNSSLASHFVDDNPAVSCYEVTACARDDSESIPVAIRVRHQVP